jgi:hypothetical protein
VLQRTDLGMDQAYNVIHEPRYTHPIKASLEQIMMKNINQLTQWTMVFSSAAVLLVAGCSSLKTPATADVAVSKAAVDNAASAGAAEYAPVEMQSARNKMALANQALAKKDYKLAADFANQAQVDAKLAQSKANSTKAQSAADALQDDIRVLREELDRSSKQ